MIHCPYRFFLLQHEANNWCLWYILLVCLSSIDISRLCSARVLLFCLGEYWKCCKFNKKLLNLSKLHQTVIFCLLKFPGRHCFTEYMEAFTNPSWVRDNSVKADSWMFRVSSEVLDEWSFVQVSSSPSDVLRNKLITSYEVLWTPLMTLFPITKVKFMPSFTNLPAVSI